MKVGGEVEIEGAGEPLIRGLDVASEVSREIMACCKILCASSKESRTQNFATN